jgi:hypothetical protein
MSAWTWLIKSWAVRGGIVVEEAIAVRREELKKEIL